ncbi:MAG TPA: transglutaminase family protein, partial [Steroidobacteraceae bacterium]|nr:transglutaminase family protein [Steroidobacteraceae bacterium]
MSVLVSLHHATRYQYDRAIALGPQIVRLRPAPHCRTRVQSYSLKVTPTEHFVNWQQDPNGNWLARFVFPERTREFTVTVDLLADMSVINPFDFFVDPAATEYPFKYPSELDEELAPYLRKETAGPLLTEYVASVPRAPLHIVDFIVALNQRLQKDIRYLIRMDPGVQATEETLKLRSGSCRDSAWLMVQILRHLGLAARFVSGYLIQLRPDLKSLDGPSGAAEDFTDLHAWTEVYVPGAGWSGLDPTSGLLCGEGHLPLAATPHYRAAAPITGGLEPAKTEFSFEMSLTRINEKPRITFPFSDDAWNDLDALGERVDADLAAQDVRLTMGGEPTFVSIDDYQSAEWNTAAVGPTKRIRADNLIRRLRDKFAPGGLLHYGQGKWYPGEELPRWAFSLLWRRDGKPIWQNAELIALEGQAHATGSDEAQRFTENFASRLGLPVEHVLPAFEDPADRMLKEGLLPPNVDPADPKIDDPIERARIMREFERSLSAPAGYVLPVQRWNAQHTSPWMSELWELRRGRLYLVPGDSPIGFRLPLNSLPYIPPLYQPTVVPADPFDDRGPLPDPIAMQRMFMGEGLAASSAGARARANTNGAGRAVRTAISVEPRDGRLCVFMPPVERLEDYLELLAAVEASAAALKLPVHI